MVRTRAIDLRTSPLANVSALLRGERHCHLFRDQLDKGRNVHPVQLGARRGDLLDAELAQLGLELSELLNELILALGPQGTGLNLGGRL